MTPKFDRAEATQRVLHVAREVLCHRATLGELRVALEALAALDAEGEGASDEDRRKLVRRIEALEAAQGKTDTDIDGIWTRLDNLESNRAGSAGRDPIVPVRAGSECSPDAMIGCAQDWCYTDPGEEPNTLQAWVDHAKRRHSTAAFEAAARRKGIEDCLAEIRVRECLTVTACVNRIRALLEESEASTVAVHSTP